MNRIKMSFIDTDYALRASADVETEASGEGFSDFIEQIREEMATGGSAYLEIEGANGQSMTLSIAGAL